MRGLAENKDHPRLLENHPKCFVFGVETILFSIVMLKDGHNLRVLLLLFKCVNGVTMNVMMTPFHFQ